MWTSRPVSAAIRSIASETREHVVGERALEPALLLLGRAEVDHPGLDPVRVQDRHGAARRRDVVDLGREHHRRHEQDRRDVGTLAVGTIGRVVAAQAVDAALGEDLVGGRLLLGLQAAEAGHLEGVLGGGADPRGGRGDRVWDERHRASGVASRAGSPEPRATLAARRLQAGQVRRKWRAGGPSTVGSAGAAARRRRSAAATMRGLGPTRARLLGARLQSPRERGGRRNPRPTIGFRVLGGRACRPPVPIPSMLGLDAPPGHPTYRLPLAALAAMAAIALLATLAAPASAREYMPPKNQIFAGVSDLGNKSDYFDFTDAIDRHVPVMQAFNAWGQPLKDVQAALEADRDARHAQHLDLALLRVRGDDQPARDRHGQGRRLPGPAQQVPLRVGTADLHPAAARDERSLEPLRGLQRGRLLAAAPSTRPRSSAAPGGGWC